MIKITVGFIYIILTKAAVDPVPMEYFIRVVGFFGCQLKFIKRKTIRENMFQTDIRFTDN